MIGISKVTIFINTNNLNHTTALNLYQSHANWLSIVQSVNMVKSMLHRLSDYACNIL